jgi:hypothetical protein
MSSRQKEVVPSPDQISHMSTPLTIGGTFADAVERRSRLVSLAYQVLGTIDVPPLDASEGEVLATLASAFHRKALVAAEAERDTRRGEPALPDDASIFWLSRR